MLKLLNMLMVHVVAGAAGSLQQECTALGTDICSLPKLHQSRKRQIGVAGELRASCTAGMVGYRFNTVGVSDAISMGTDGMSFSLQSRDLIADSIETVMGAQW